jgi:small subunit ribosomal protein S2
VILYTDKNKNSLRCIQVIAGVLGRAGEQGQEKRLEAAKTGKITWLPPPGLGEPATEESRRREAMEKAMAKSKSTPVRKETNKDDDDFEDIML